MREWKLETGKYRRSDNTSGINIRIGKVIDFKNSPDKLPILFYFIFLRKKKREYKILFTTLLFILMYKNYGYPLYYTMVYII